MEAGGQNRRMMESRGQFNTDPMSRFRPIRTGYAQNISSIIREQMSIFPGSSGKEKVKFHHAKKMWIRGPFKPGYGTFPDGACQLPSMTVMPVLPTISF
ncbi:MAG TPA: hypothetical protein ENN44_04470 [Methanoculleus sp.]|nr:hypothetical protein [Methanoculleus sp.]